MLDFRIDGWTTASALAIDDARCVTVLVRADADAEVTRRLLVRVRPVMLKRYVEFFAVHELLNDTDTHIEVALDPRATVRHKI